MTDPTPKPKLRLVRPGSAPVDIVDVDIPELPEGVSLEDDFYGFMEQHHYFYVPTRAPWPAVSINARFGKGSSVWLDRNRPVEQITWAPGEPMLIKDRLIRNSGWVPRRGVAVFNLYQPPAVEPGDPAKAGPWLDHIKRIYPDDGDHIVRWFAHRVQHPEDKINHILVLGGDPGIGKDTVIEPVLRATGPWNCEEIGPKQLNETFNGFAKSVILRISEARNLGSETDRYGFYEQLKIYAVVPPKVIRVNEKHLRQYSIPNVCGVIITTNHKSDGIYLRADDRRHYVAWSFAQMKNFNEAYWNRMWRWYNAGGDADIAAYLRTLDLSSFDPKAPPLKTAAFWEIVGANQAPEDAELADIIELMGDPDVVSLAALIEKSKLTDGHQAIGEWLADRKHRRAIPHRLETCKYVAVRNPNRLDGLWKIDGHRSTIYGKASLSRDEQVAAAEAEIKKPLNDMFGERSDRTV